MYVSRQTVHFYDADPAGVLFFSRIYNLCHAAYEDFLADAGLDKADVFLHPTYALPIIHSEADYFAAIRVGDSVDVHLSIPQLRTSSFEVRSEVYGADGIARANVSTIHVCVNKDTWSKTPLPSEWRRVLKRYAVKNGESGESGESM